MARTITKYCPHCKRTSRANIWISGDAKKMFLICVEDNLIIKEIDLYTDGTENMRILEF